MTDTELSLAVAKASGIEIIHVGKTKCVRVREIDSKWPSNSPLFDPANDWNDAMEAAKKVKLFRTHKLTQLFSGEWEVRHYALNDVWQDASGPRAICEAIVTTKGGE